MNDSSFAFLAKLTQGVFIRLKPFLNRVASIITNRMEMCGIEGYSERELFQSSFDLFISQLCQRVVRESQ